MANTYSKIYVQIIFAVKHRQSYISEKWEKELYKYINGIVRGTSNKLYAIGGVQDHLHLLISYRPSVCLSDLVRDIKSNSSGFVNRKGYVDSGFQWQKGYGSFSYGQSQVSDVIRYIENQKTHHKHHTFREEYLAFLRKFNIDHDEKYLFEFYDSD